MPSFIYASIYLTILELCKFLLFYFLYFLYIRSFIDQLIISSDALLQGYLVYHAFRRSSRTCRRSIEPILRSITVVPNKIVHITANRYRVIQYNIPLLSVPKPTVLYMDPSRCKSKAKRIVSPPPFPLFLHACLVNYHSFITYEKQKSSH